MSINYYLHRVLFFLTIPVLAALLYFFGGNAEHFDRIYIAALCISCLFCWSDKDTLGALAILLAYWLCSEVLYVVTDEWPYWLVIYGSSIILSIYYFQHITAKILLIFTLYSIAAEWLWWSVDYADKPKIIYLIGLSALSVVLRQLLFERVFIMHKYFNDTSGKTALDVHVGGILFVYFVLVLMVTLEYFIRHLGELRDITTIYYLFRPLSTLISGVTLAIVYMHYFYNQSQKHLSV